MKPHDFCRALLTITRRDMPKDAPKNLSTVGSGFKECWLVEDGKGFAEEVEGCCKWAAQTAALNVWLRGREANETLSCG